MGTAGAKISAAADGFLSAGDRRRLRRRRRQAIAAALARDDLLGGERLAAFSLASFAGRDDRAWIARAAARRVPLALSAPDSSPALAYAGLAETLEEVSTR
jgi:hypothetical protein